MNATASQSSSLSADVREIPLTMGYVATVDAADFDWLNQWSWTASVARDGRVYAKSTEAAGAGRRAARMHRLIINCPNGLLVDHRDGDTLNCRRSNLRTCTHLQNIRNAVKRSDSFAPYKGIERRKNRWWARIKVDGQSRRIGSFASAEEAARAYDAAALKHFGEFACLNFPTSPDGRSAICPTQYPLPRIDPVPEPAKPTTYRGVYPIRRHYTAQIKAAGERFYLGVFDTAEEAARAYDAAAQQHHGASARLNFPEARRVAGD